MFDVVFFILLCTVVQEFNALLFAFDGNAISTMSATPAPLLPVSSASPHHLPAALKQFLKCTAQPSSVSPFLSRAYQPNKPSSTSDASSNPAVSRDSEDDETPFTGQCEDRLRRVFQLASAAMKREKQLHQQSEDKRQQQQPQQQQLSPCQATASLTLPPPTTARPVIVFLDELDAWCPVRGDGVSAEASRVVAQMLTLLDGLHDSDGVRTAMVVH
jgi:hypothetical protein